MNIREYKVVVEMTPNYDYGIEDLYDWDIIFYNSMTETYDSVMSGTAPTYEKAIKVAIENYEEHYSPFKDKEQLIYELSVHSHTEIAGNYTTSQLIEIFKMIGGDVKECMGLNRRVIALKCKERVELLEQINQTPYTSN